DGSAVGKGFQGQQGAVAAVDPVHVQVAGVVGQGQGGGDGAQCLGAAATAGAHDVQVAGAGGVEGIGVLALPGGCVHQPDGDGPYRAGFGCGETSAEQLVEGEAGGQGGQPG